MIDSYSLLLQKQTKTSIIHKEMSLRNYSYNPLNGQHLRTVWPNWEGNPKGLNGPIKGGLIINYLADRFHFTYEMVQVAENQLDIPVGGKGLFSYLVNNQCDLLVYPVSPSSERVKLVDITTPWYYTTLEFLIPVLDDEANISAIVKPFQRMVWFLLLVSIVVVLFVFYQLGKYESHNFLVSDRTESVGKTPPKNETGRLYLYVFGNLLSQGGDICQRKRMSFRLVAGAWTLAAFIFVQAYNSTLITYVITPSQYPLIYSAYDIPNDPSIALYIRKASTGERMIMNPNSTGIYAKLRERVNSVPESRCVYQANCLAHLKPGSKNIYLEPLTTLIDIIKAEYDNTGTCKLEIAKEPLASAIGGLGLQNNSPFTETISKGLLELLENGLINHWDVWFRSLPQKCSSNIKLNTKKTNRKPGHVPLSLKNLSGSFVVLAVGLTLSALTFFCEITISSILKHHKRFRKT